MSTVSTLTHATTLGPLNDEQRVAIMEQARPMDEQSRRVFRRLLILNQHRDLDLPSIARLAAQAREHAAEA